MTDDAQVDETLRRRFEKSWRQGIIPSIHDFLPRPDSIHYAATLEELVAIDLEFRWRNHTDETEEGPRLEAYLAEFPLAGQTDMLVRLVEAEVDARRQSGNRPDVAEYQARFPSLCENARLTRLFSDESTNDDPRSCLNNTWMLRISGTPYVYRPPPGGHCSVGRRRRRAGEPHGAGNDLVIRVADSQRDSLRISRCHFELQQQLDGLFIIDRSKAGTMLNTTPLIKGLPTRVRPGDQILVGGVLTLEVLLEAITAETVSVSAMTLPPGDDRGASVIIEASAGALTTDHEAGPA